tara:strand:+ start:183 stop:1034 length:852 start_codon:yes stop_codon:yes gene_type:complete
MPINPKEVTLEPSTLENIDMGMYEWIRDTLDLHTTTNTGYKKVPVIWLGAERSFQVKNNKELRNSDDRLRLPIIAVTRESVAKDPSFKGAFQAHYYQENDYKGGVVTIYRKINQKKHADYRNTQFTQANKNKRSTGRIPPSRAKERVLYQQITIPVPSYVTVMYNIILRTEYQQQMNDLVSPFISRTGNINSFFFERNNYKYESFIQQDFTETKNIKDLGEDERMFETSVQIKVLGYLIGNDNNSERPKVVIRENAVRTVISNERVILGDKVPWKDKDNDYTE